MSTRSQFSRTDLLVAPDFHFRKMSFAKFSAKLSTSGSLASSRGRTLIELIVAMALSLLILLGVGSLFLGANQSSRTASGISGAEEGASYVMMVLGNAIRRAGYSEIIGKNASPIDTRSNLLYGGPRFRGCVGSLLNDTVAGTCGGAAVTGDVLAVWFQANNVLGPAQGATTDCLGLAAQPFNIVDPGFKGAIPGGQIPVVVNQYYINPATNSLMCRGNNGVTDSELVRNVVDFKVFYSFDDVAYAAAGSSSSALNERPAGRSIWDATAISNTAPVGGLSPWEFVLSAHVCVTLRTEETGVTSSIAPTFTPCPTDVGKAAGTAPNPAIGAPAGDIGAIRRSYTEVFTIRSRAAPTPATPI